MLHLRIKDLMKEKGVQSPNKTMTQLKISDKIATKYLHDKKKQWILINHIEKLCLCLRCEPNDLFEWTPDNKLQDDPNQPLQNLKPRPLFDLDAAIKNCTPAELRELLMNKDVKDKKK